MKPLIPEIQQIGTFVRYRTRNGPRNAFPYQGDESRSIGEPFDCITHLKYASSAICRGYDRSVPVPLLPFHKITGIDGRNRQRIWAAATRTPFSTSRNTCDPVYELCSLHVLSHDKAGNRVVGANPLRLEKSWGFCMHTCAWRSDSFNDCCWSPSHGTTAQDSLVIRTCHRLSVSVEVPLVITPSLNSVDEDKDIISPGVLLPLLLLVSYLSFSVRR